MTVLRRGDAAMQRDAATPERFTLLGERAWASCELSQLGLDRTLTFLCFFDRSFSRSYSLSTSDLSAKEMPSILLAS